MRRSVMTGLALVAAAAIAAGGAAAAVNVGDIAPDFTALNQWGGTTTLYDSMGKVIVLDLSASW